MTLFTKEIQGHLTSAPFDKNARLTYPGQAHFAETGPSGRTCRECVFYKHSPGDYYARNGKHRGLIQPAPCRKFQQLTRSEGPAIPDHALSCKYFEENPEPPSRYMKAD